MFNPIILAGLPGFIEFVVLAVSSMTLLMTTIFLLAEAIGRRVIKKNMEKINSDMNKNLNLAHEKIVKYNNDNTQKNFLEARNAVEVYENRKAEILDFYGYHLSNANKKFNKLMGTYDQDKINLVNNFNLNNDKKSVVENNSIPKDTINKENKVNHEIKNQKDNNKTNRTR